MSAAVKPSWSSYAGIIVWFQNIDPKCCFPFAQQKVSVRIISAAWLRHDLMNVRETEYETDWWDPSLKTHIITPAQSKDKGHNMSHTHKTLDFMSRMFSPRPLPWLYKIPVYFTQSSLERVGRCSFGTFLFDFYCCSNIVSLQKLKSLHLFFCLFFSCCTSKQQLWTPELCTVTLFVNLLQSFWTLAHCWKTRKWHTHTSTPKRRQLLCCQADLFAVQSSNNIHAAGSRCFKMLLWALLSDEKQLCSFSSLSVPVTLLKLSNQQKQQHHKKYRIFHFQFG